MDTVSAGTERREQLVLNEFTLEIPADKAQTFAQALGDLPWSAFQSVVLEGENVNDWLELLGKVDSLRLKCLKLVGTITLAQLQQQQQQVLSEFSV
ncbi:hypothetical protein MVEG_10722 [Podila verticillata NRRL 6337]|nr:hypothetical protein MVEG_10722 [Podila verticillata NRRL 6337]